jgi:hypothetical protein
MSARLIVGLALSVLISPITQSNGRASAAPCEGDFVAKFLHAGCPIDGNTRPKSDQLLQTKTIDDPAAEGGDGLPSNCDYVFGFTFDPADPHADITVNSSGRRQDLYEIWCNGVYDNYTWVDAPLGGPPAITAADLLPGVWVRVQRELPKPVARIAPADFDSNGFTFVQNHTFFWVDHAQGQWAPVTGSASAGGITVSVQATPIRLVVDTGDGQTVTCDGVPPAFAQGMDPTSFPGCAHVYQHSSAMAPNGQTFPVSVTIEWSASWSASTGEDGDLGVRRTTGDVRQLAVAESQAVIVRAGG